MSEDMGLCTDVKHHKSKIALFFFAMRSYRELLINNGYKVNYMDINNKFSSSYIDKLKEYIQANSIQEIVFYEIEDKPFETELFALINELNLGFTELESPMFLDNRKSFTDFVSDKKFILQANYYKKNRKEFNYLVDGAKPIGGKWSYDELNRLKVPKNYELPTLPKI
jgi:deoxyribodipyrimidine photolyase-related protein